MTKRATRRQQTNREISTTTTTEAAASTNVFQTTELLLAILSFLPRSPTFAFLPCVDTSWRSVADRDYVWASHIDREAPHLTPLVKQLQQQQEEEEEDASSSSEGDEEEEEDDEEDDGFASVKSIFSAWWRSNYDIRTEEVKKEEVQALWKERFDRCCDRLQVSHLEFRLMLGETQTLVATQLLPLDDMDALESICNEENRGAKMEKVQPKYAEEGLETVEGFDNQAENMTVAVNLVDAKKGRVIPLALSHRFDYFDEEEGGGGRFSGAANHITYMMAPGVHCTFDVILARNGSGGDVFVKMDYAVGGADEYLKMAGDVITVLEMVVDDVLMRAP